MKRRKKRWKKVWKKVWYSIAVIMFLFLFLCGCGKGAGGADGEAAAAGGKEPQGNVYAVKHQLLNEYCDSVSAVMIWDGRKVYFTGARDNADILFVLDIDGAEGEGVREYPLETEPGMRVSVIGRDAEGNLLLGMIGYQGGSVPDGEASGGTVGRVIIQKLSPDGVMLGNVDTGNVFWGRDAASFYINGLYQDGGGDYYLSAAKEVCVLHEDGSMYFNAAAGDYVSTLFALEDDRVVAGYGGRDGWKLGEVDFARKGLKPLESSIGFGKGVYRSGTDKDLVYTEGGALYACNLADEEPEVLLHWADYDINGGNIQDFAVLPDGRIVSVTADYSNGAARELSILAKKEGSGTEEKTVLHYAALYVPYYTERDIAEFNKQSEKYRIEVQVYGDDAMEYKDRMALLDAALAGGQAIDIIALGDGGPSLEKLVSAGAAEDLTPYFEGDDAVRREDFLENVMEAYERDGKLYAVMPSFGIRTLAGKASEVGEGSTWSVEEMTALADSKGKDTELLENADKGTVLWLVCMLNEGLFIDWETGSCDFTGGDFGEFLEFADRFPSQAAYGERAGSETEPAGKIRDGKVLLSDCVITSAEAYQLYEYEFGEPVNFIGYPTAGTSGQILVPRGTAAVMHSASENKEGVWEFIRFCLSEGRQEKLRAINGDGFPIRKSALDKLLKEEMREEYYEDANGNRKVRPKNTWAVGELNIDVYAVTQEQADGIRRMIETARMGEGMDDKIFEIIYEEAEAYFNGMQSADRTAELIQNRVQTYMDERQGGMH